MAVVYDVSFTVEGVNQAAVKLQELGTLLNDMKPTHRQVAKVISSRAKSYAPVDTGRLRRSVRARATKHTAVVSAGGHSAWWAHMVEYGFHHKPSAKRPQPYTYPVNPFMLHAAEHTAPQWVDLYTKAINEKTSSIDKQV